MVILKRANTIGEVKEILLGETNTFEVYVQKNYASDSDDGFNLKFSDLILGLDYLKFLSDIDFEAEIGYLENVTKKYKLNLDIKVNKKDKFIVLYSSNSCNQDIEHMDIFNFLINNHYKLFRKHIFIPLSTNNEIDFYDYIRNYIHRLSIILLEIDILKIFKFIYGDIKYLDLIKMYSKYDEEIDGTSNEKDKNVWELDIFNIEELREFIKELYNIYYFGINIVFTSGMGQEISSEDGCDVKVVPALVKEREYYDEVDLAKEDTSPIKLIKFDIENAIKEEINTIDAVNKLRRL